MVIPDQGPDDEGCVLIPCSVGVVRGARFPKAAAAFVRFVSGVRGEGILVSNQPGHLSIHGSTNAGDLPDLSTIKLTQVSVTALAATWAETRRVLAETFD
jgi:ABC-type Fe3+ transport system substrate-binding protein